MTKKLNNLSNDIKKLLDKHEPSQLRWNEIEKELYPSYKSYYKSRKVFGIALSYYLTHLEADHLIKHQGMYYGSLNSKSPELEALTDTRNELRMVYDEVLRLRLHSHDYSEFYRTLGLLVEMDVRFRETYEDALRNASARRMKTAYKTEDGKLVIVDTPVTLTEMTTSEIDTLLGELGRVLDQIQSVGRTLRD